MGTWAQSRGLTSTAWAVVRENSYFFGFPVIGFALSLIPIVVFWIPAIVLLALDANVAGIVLLVVGGFAVSMAGSFTVGAMVACADEELAGRDASIGYGYGRSFSRAGTLMRWALIQTVVSALMSLVRGNGEGSVVGVLLRSVLAAAASVAWQIITFFTVPFIMLEGAGPIDSIKRSAGLVKQRWGLQIAGGVRIGGLIGLATILPGILAIVGGVLLTIAGLVVIGIPLVVIGIVLFIVGSLLIGVVKAVFSVALFRYAETGQALGGFTEQDLMSAVRVKAAVA